MMAFAAHTENGASTMSRSKPLHPLVEPAGPNKNGEISNENCRAETCYESSWPFPLRGSGQALSVTVVYNRRCAITGETPLPRLNARPTWGPRHRRCNRNRTGSCRIWPFFGVTAITSSFSPSILLKIGAVALV